LRSGTRRDKYRGDFLVRSKAAPLQLDARPTHVRLLDLASDSFPVTAHTAVTAGKTCSGSNREPPQRAGRYRRSG